MANASILVGAGGSGIKTLMRLNGLMAEDPYWRHRISRDIYYVLLDTELKIIDEFQRAVDRQLAGAEKPVIRALRIAQGHVILQPLVNRFFERPFVGGKDPRGQERLYEHWWTHPKHGPFKAPKVKPLTQGAGQCPAASYFLTWRELTDVESVFEELMEELIARRSGDGPDPFQEMNFCIVAGLAGGTGRGSWQLIAFKVRELLTEKYGIPAPVAYLFDAGVFENICRRYPRQELPMKVNSLTGISELSCWVQNMLTTGNPPLLYQLPSMESPADPQMDVLSVDLSLDTAAAAPVDNAYLIFPGHQRAVLASNDQYHEMVGTGLYAALSRSALQATRINEAPPYRSLGAATFEVNSSTLRGYFEGLSRIHILECLSRPNDVPVNRAVERFLQTCHLRIGISAEKRDAYKADAKGTLMQRACYELMESADIKLDLGALKQALENDEPSEVETAVTQLVEPRDLLAEKAVQSAVEAMQRPAEAAAGSEPGEGAPEKQSVEDVARELVSQLLQETRSVENVGRFVEKVCARLDVELDNLPAPDRMQMEADQEPLTLVQEYKTAEYFGMFGQHFNADESNDLQDQTRRAVLYANYRVLCEKIRQRYSQWKSLISRWKAAADLVRATADKLVVKFKNELQDDLKTAGGDASDFFDALFGDADCPENAIPEDFSKGVFYYRELKPVLNRGAEAKLLGDPEFRPELAEVVSRALLSAGLHRDAYDELEKFRRELEAAIRRTVHLPARFIEKHFSIRSVVKDLKIAWLRRFEEVRGKADDLRKLVDRFHRFFGVRPKPDGDQLSLPRDDEFLLSMGASLAATCRPYWRLRDGDASNKARVSLFLPLLSDRIDREAAEKRIHEQLKEANVTVEVFIEQEQSDELGETPANPFIILAYSVDGTDDIKKIASLDYWRSPTVKELLVRCEDTSGCSVFEHTAQHNGVSYTDPLFIRNEAVRGSRWKPWVDEDAGKEVGENEAYDALLYALIEADGSLKEELEKRDWPLPLIRNRGQQWYEFTRRARLIWTADSPQAREDTGCPWKARMPIAQGIRQTFDVLAGEGRKDGTLKIEGPVWANRMRQESRDFWHAVLPALKVIEGTEVYLKLLSGLETRIDQEAQDMEKDDPDVDVWKALLARLKRLRELGDL